jgi:peptidylamidoglycolate lyase
MSKIGRNRLSMLVAIIITASSSPVLSKDQQQENSLERGKWQPYSVVRGWPQVPEDKILGQISGIGIDSKNRIFAFDRAENSWPADPAGPPHFIAYPSNPDLPIIPSPTILSFDGASGKFLNSWGDNLFYHPHGLRIDKNDHLWLTDILLHQVFEYTTDGKLLRTLGVARAKGEDETHFNEPTDVAIGPDGSIYVSDGYGNNRVVKFSAAGKFLMAWGHKGDGPSEFNLPHSITIDQAGNVYVADRGNARIQVFDPNGKFLAMFKSPELGVPWAVTIGPDNLLYVMDAGYFNNPGRPSPEHLLKLDLSGKILAKWGRVGTQDGQTRWGHDVAVGKDGAVYVGEVWHAMRIQKFMPN